MKTITNAKHLINLKGEVVTKDFPAQPTFNAVPDNSDAGAPCHVYLTAQGVIFWRPNGQVIIPMSELKAAVKVAEPNFCSPPAPLARDVKPKIANPNP